MEKKTYIVHRSMHGDGRDYERGDTRELIPADAVFLVSTGALSLEGEEPLAPQPAVNHMFGMAQSEVNDRGGLLLNREPALRDTGPTVEEYVAKGYRAVNYPPVGYASRSTADEISAAIAAQVEASELGVQETGPEFTADDLETNDIGTGDSRSDAEFPPAPSLDLSPAPDGEPPVATPAKPAKSTRAKVND